MTTTLLTRPTVRTTYNRATAHTSYHRACDRCGTERVVRDPNAKRNLCTDCVSVLSPTEVERWAA